MSQGTGKSGFRPDIQGLRAVAVLMVVVYHVFPQTYTGGYVGVDVFFVISGFLISGLLLREHQETACDVLRATAMGHGGAVSLAAQADPRLKLLDMTDVFCDDTNCPAIVGNVVVYRDQHHITTAYMRTIAPALDLALIGLIEP